MAEGISSIRYQLVLAGSSWFQLSLYTTWTASDRAAANVVQVEPSVHDLDASDRVGANVVQVELGSILVFLSLYLSMNIYNGFLACVETPK